MVHVDIMVLVSRHLTCAESEINNKTRSLPEIVSHMSPKVPFSSVKPAARASSKEQEPFLKQIFKEKHGQYEHIRKNKNKKLKKIPETLL